MKRGKWVEICQNYQEIRPFCFPVREGIGIILISGPGKFGDFILMPSLSRQYIIMCYGYNVELLDTFDTNLLEYILSVRLYKLEMWFKFQYVTWNI